MKTELITEATASLKKQVQAELEIADPVHLEETIAKLFKESQENEQGQAS